MNDTMTFEQLGIEESLSTRLANRGIITPTMIQRQTIPVILRGERVVAKSQTGSGKSLAYILPLIQRLQQEESSQLLILTPTRELAQQVNRVCVQLTDLCAIAIYGGVEYEAQQKAFACNPRIIVATPGRLQDLIARGIAVVDHVKYFVLDEVDQMVDMGFREVISELAKLRVEGSQSLCFSATLPDGVESVIREIIGEYKVIESVSQPLAAQSITQSGYYVEQTMMDQLLIHLLRAKQPSRAIVFCRSRKMADRLNSVLHDSSFVSEAIHSERSQAAREHILARFKSAETEILVATDLMARGIDVDGVSHVFNFGLPQNPEQYIHRIGRTGRAGESGEAVSLICPDEAKLLSATCALMRQNIPMSTSHPYMTPVVTLALSGEKSRKKSHR